MFKQIKNKIILFYNLINLFLNKLIIKFVLQPKSIQQFIIAFFFFSFKILFFDFSHTNCEAGGDDSSSTVDSKTKPLF